MKALELIVALTIVVLICGALSEEPGSPPGPPLPPPPPLSRIQEMSDLATLRVHLSDSIVGENNNWKVVWVLHGEAVLGVDLSQANYVSVDEQERMVTLSMPAPHVISNKIDHQRSMEMSVEQKTLIPYSGLKSLRDNVWRHADEKVAVLARSDAYVRETKLQAERVLNRLFEDVEWRITYVWQVPSTETADTIPNS